MNKKLSQNPNGSTSYQILQVIDKLEIGPVKLDPTHLRAPYMIYQNGKVDKIDLIYRYEEKVFKPDNLSDQNLAAVIAAQVAINYGLFCKEIVFKGYYDQQDKTLIRDMFENTAREIYVKKFMQPNPFLTNSAAVLPPLRLMKYNQASIYFESTMGLDSQLAWYLRETKNERHAILSSGGKDSLLSFGLLNEIGKEVHPIFINESGRHWYTALNAYNHFKNHIPNTARVWTNSDRVFNWMLRHFDFIRKDFFRVRSDEYPIRLWTVAIFLFAALPLLFKRNIARLIIGDEYDTTTRTLWQGVRHYNGLFDQSRYFDNLMSRYFMGKGWSITQFSVLRYLSEMLILKVLTKRYPHLQEHQVSCHASHIKEGRVLPCGKCEKCRRMIAMLIANDDKPSRCGYNKQQIAANLLSLEKKGIHQESAGQQQLLYMLQEKGNIKTTKIYKAKQEILHLRLDDERSPINNIPVDLRLPLFKIYAKYSQGTLRRTRKIWEKVDLFKDIDLFIPFPFEKSKVTGKNVKQKTTERTSFLWAELTWPEAEEYLKMMDVAILPVGAIEQHGPHLPLDTDSFDADYLAKQVADACSDPKPLVLPLIPYGVSYHHDDFKGTITINNYTLSKLVYEIGMSIARNGIKKLLIINGHGGNSPSLNFAAQMINRDAKIFVSIDSGETSDFDIYKLVETPNDVHAGEFETSTSLATRPHLVKLDQAQPSIPSFSSRYLNFTSKRGISWYAYTKRISKSGIMGDPTKADVEKGEKIWQIMIAHLVTFVEDLKNMSLEEIHQRRY